MTTCSRFFTAHLPKGSLITPISYIRWSIVRKKYIKLICLLLTDPFLLCEMVFFYNIWSSRMHIMELCIIMVTNYFVKWGFYLPYQELIAAHPVSCDDYFVWRGRFCHISWYHNRILHILQFHCFYTYKKCNSRFK